MIPSKALECAGKISAMYSRILSRFPQKNMSFCFAYGSAVKQQAGTIKEKQMIDFIFCVDNSLEWHRENLASNPGHYSFFKHFGAGFIAKYQENLGANVYFNTLVPIEEENVMIKYGVISERHLIQDLTQWRHLYMAGRLQKPVEILFENSDHGKFRNCIESNRKGALSAALLMLPENFTEFQLYRAVANLSYSGDFRMIFGENKKKVDNIVKPQMDAFRGLYNQFTAELHKNMKNPETVFYTQDISPQRKLFHLECLPWCARDNLEKLWLKRNNCGDPDAVLRLISVDKDCSMFVKKAIDKIVWNSSVSQSIKGILAAGMLKSLTYSAKKIKKMFQ